MSARNNAVEFVNLDSNATNQYQEASTTCFFNWVPANQPVWCYADNVRCLRDLQLRFHANAIESIIEGNCDLSKVQEPLLMIYDAKVTSCANVLADACAEEFPHDRLYGESLTVALIVALMNASNNRKAKHSTNGLAS